MHFGDRSDISDQVREMLQPSPVKRGVAPRWVLKGVKRAIEDGRIPKPDAALTSGGTALEEATRLLGSSWKDHAGKFTWDGIEFLVSEPYADRIDLRMLTELERFTEALGTSYFFSANSEHFPGRTVRMVIGPTNRDTTEYKKHEWASAMERIGRAVEA
jgi:hypothetical protein